VVIAAARVLTRSARSKSLATAARQIGDLTQALGVDARARLPARGARLAVKDRIGAVGLENRLERVTNRNHPRA